MEEESKEKANEEDTVDMDQINFGTGTMFTGLPPTAAQATMFSSPEDGSYISSSKGAFSLIKGHDKISLNLDQSPDFSRNIINRIKP